jgi:RNA-directed DNA polymerase
MIKRGIKDPNVLWLIKLILDSTPAPGIPIGNLASQIFANLYLNGLDHYLKETIKCQHYIRYMDDLVVFGNEKDWLGEIKKDIGEYLQRLRLKLHPNKSRIYLTTSGIGFLGYKIYPTHRLISKQNIKRAKRRIKKYLKLLGVGMIHWSKLTRSIRSWLGYAIHADSFNLRRRLLGELGLLYEGISP